MLPLCAAFVFGCHGEVQGTGGSNTVDSTPLCADSDPRQVAGTQKVALLTSTQLINMIRLVSADEAKTINDNQIVAVLPDLLVRFPPQVGEQFKSIVDSTALGAFDLPAQTLGNYVRDNFATVTGCATTDETCAVNYLNATAKKAYRRTLTAEETDRFTGPTGLYHTLRSQLVNGYQVTTTIESATGNSIYGLFMSPQLLWRWEIGSQPSTSPPGVYLSDAELASALSFMLTDQPPDDMLVAAADAGTLRANIATHVDRILATQSARDWMTHVIGMYFKLNQLPGIVIDDTKFPLAANGAVLDLKEEGRLYLNDVLWSGKVMDLITSHKAFINTNTNLATIYGLPAAPAGAGPTTFVEADLPASERAGMLTNAGFLATNARATGVGIVPRGLAVKGLFLCLETPPPPDTLRAAGGPIATQTAMLDMQTAQEQVAYRTATAPCNSCHPTFDPYGLVLDWYDVVGKSRTIDDLGKPVDGHTTLPADIGGQTVQSAVELAGVLANNDVFMNCMAKNMVQYALINETIEVPIPARGQAGCPAVGVAHKVRTSGTQSFTDMMRAVATSPAFLIRKQAM